jgi:serine/threonine protein kinase
MSPEQTMGKGEDTDHRADQWALACIAWEMLSGYPPFGGDDVATLFHQINRVDPPPLDKVVPNLFPSVDAVLRKALSKHFSERYPSIREFAQALETAAFGRWAELSTPRQFIPELDLVDASSGHRAVADVPSLVAEARLPAVRSEETSDEAARNSISASVDPFRATHESVARTVPIWRRPSVAAAAGLVLLAGATLLLRSSQPTPTAPPPATAFSLVAQAKAVPVAPDKPAALLGVAQAPVVDPLKQPAPRKRARIRQAHDPGAAATSEVSRKRKALKSHPKPKIFREL